MSVFAYIHSHIHTYNRHLTVSSIVNGSGVIVEATYVKCFAVGTELNPKNCKTKFLTTYPFLCLYMDGDTHTHTHWISSYVD